MSDKFDGSSGKNQIESQSDIPTPKKGGRKNPSPRRDSRKSRNQNLRSNSHSNSSQNSDYVGGSQSNKTERSLDFVNKNISIGTIVSKYFNANVLNQSYRTLTDQTLDLNLTIKIFDDRLKAQAVVWAEKVSSLHDLQLKNIIGKGIENWEQKLEDCYIYSFYSSVLYALSDAKVAEFSEQRYFLKGHLVLHKFLLTTSHSFQHNGYTVRYNFRYTDERLQEILTKAKSFSFIKENIGENPRFYLENQELDRILGGLKTSMPSRGPDICKASDMMNIESNLSKDFFALGNSFYTNDDNCNEWSYSFRPDSDILHNSTLFGKSCFMSLFKINDISNFYDKINVDDEFYLTKYEVSNICGSEFGNYKK